MTYSISDPTSMKTFFSTDIAFVEFEYTNKALTFEINGFSRISYNYRV